MNTPFSTREKKGKIDNIMTMNVLCEDWCVAMISKFLDFETVGKWDEAMCSHAAFREKWLLSLGKVKITGIDEYKHHYNESIRWLISRRMKHVTKISVCLRQKYHDTIPKQACRCTPGVMKSSTICGKTFCGARMLADLKSIILYENKWEYYKERPIYDPYIPILPEILESLSVNCKSLENVEMKGDSAYACVDAAANMVQKLPRLHSFTFTHYPGYEAHPEPQGLSAPLILALAQHCPLLESLHLGQYNDEVDQLVTGCPRLHTITIDSGYVTIASCQAFGRSRSIATLHLNAWCAEETAQILVAMADEDMPLRTINLYSELSCHVDELDYPSFGNTYVSIITRFAATLEDLTINDLLLSQMTDEGIAVLQQCHQLRSIRVRNLKKVTGSFFVTLSEGCPLIESIRVEQFWLGDDDQTDRGYFPPLATSAYTNIDFRPCFERCPKLKHVVLPLCSDEQIKAMVQHCPLVEEVVLGCRNLLQELSEITDDAVETMARGLSLLTKVTLTHTQCTDAGLKALSEGVCRHTLASLTIVDGTWEQGYPTLLTEKGIRKVIAGCPHLTHLHCNEKKMKEEEVRKMLSSRKQS